MEKIIMKYFMVTVVIILPFIFPITGFCANAMATDNYSFTIIADTVPPYTESHNPSAGMTGVSENSNVIVHVKDDGVGVDINTIAMTVNGQSVSPSITGTSADYTLTYDPSADFQLGQIVYVTVDASDLAN